MIDDINSADAELIRVYGASLDEPTTSPQNVTECDNVENNAEA